MADISVYTFEDKDGNEYGNYVTQDYQEAKSYAQANKLRVIGNEYVFRDSELVDDFTEKACDNCPSCTDDEGCTMMCCCNTDAWSCRCAGTPCPCADHLNDVDA